jgi:hypothetical protein
MSVFSEDTGRRRSLLAARRGDINQASALAAYAEEHVPEINDLWIPLQDAVVIAYARPFTSNKPFGALPARWSKFDDLRNQSLHDEILRMRHEVVPHSDALSSIRGHLSSEGNPACGWCQAERGSDARCYL